MEQFLQFIFQAVALLFGVVIHESAHAWMANRCGDPTARLMGRITLNPVPHIDPIGSVIVPGALILFNLFSKVNGPVFGWAKPVLVNPYNLRRPRRDSILVSAAGPVSNIISAALALIILKIALPDIRTIEQNSTLGYILVFLFNFVIINVFLAVFNLIPIPPLDGSGILEGMLHGQALQIFRQIKPYGFFILIMIFYARILDSIFNPILQFIYYLIKL